MDPNLEHWGHTIVEASQEPSLPVYYRRVFMIAALSLISRHCEGCWEIISNKHTLALTCAPIPLPFGRRYVKHSSSPNSESRVSASATFASSSQAAECSSSGVGGCGSPLSEGASHCAGSSNGQAAACNETNGLYDGEQQQKTFPENVFKKRKRSLEETFCHFFLHFILKVKYRQKSLKVTQNNTIACGKFSK